MFSLRYNLRVFSVLFNFVVFAVCWATSPLAAQAPPGALMQPPESFSMGTSEMYDMGASRKSWVVAGRVMTMEGSIIPGARVQVSPLEVGEYRLFKTDASGEFQTVYSLKVAWVRDFMVQLTVSKKGFQTAHELVDLADYPKPVRLPITLRPDEQDLSLLSQESLNTHLLPELQSLGPADGISAKSEKAYAKGIHEFVGKGRPDRSLRYFSNVVKNNAACAKCRTMLALAELEAGNWDGAARDDNSAVQLTLKDRRTGSPEAMLLAGVMESWMHNPQAATNFLVWAHKLDPKDSLALQEIGRAQLQLHQYEMADAYLSRALAAGAGPEARLLLVKAMLGEDDISEANLQMKRYLNGRKAKTMPVTLRRIWLELQSRKEIDTLYTGSKKRKWETLPDGTIDYLHDSTRQLKGLVPAKDQAELKPILAAVGKNVAALFRDFQNTTSLEKVHLQKLRHNGKVSGSLDEKFRYLCLMPSDPAVPGFTEYRKNIDQEEGKRSDLERGYMLTSGFVSAELIFHPVFQSESEFRYLGHQMMDGRETYVIAFAQDPAKAELVGMFKSGDKSAPTFDQGLAWIDPQNDQIVRLRTDLLRPLPKVRLMEETTQIDYQDVHFKKLAQGFWLPKVVTVTVNWKGKKLRNEHQYSDFKLFNVADAEKIKNPKKPKAQTKGPADSQAPHK
ncbi:MAG: carboxypeptidase-like regulatory domain-containing protein [Acidobacteriota bacterium]